MIATHAVYQPQWLAAPGEWEDCRYDFAATPEGKAAAIRFCQEEWPTPERKRVIERIVSERKVWP